MIDKDYYEPRGETAEILDIAYELVQSVPYQVSARWLFYRLLQLNKYQTKQDYSNKWLKAVSRARHASYKLWRPDTLADETREALPGGHGFATPSEWVHALAEQISCNLEKWSTQEHYVEIWFEARAMIDQFRHYTEHITLRPMGGQPSIPYKYETAKDLERYSRRYDLPIVILYFGDLDSGGEMIEQVTRDDVQKWCSVDFRFIRCGLNPIHPARYNIPENPEKPGDYQWEALDDAAARDLITTNVAEFVDDDAIYEAVQRDKVATTRIREALAEIASGWED